MLIVLVALVLLSGCATTPTAAPPPSTGEALPPVTDETPAGSEGAGEPTETIIILHTNDFHGAVEPEEGRGASEEGGLVNMVSLIDQLRAEHPGRTLLLDA
ncbi:MAG: hypothetical protein GWN58_04605, partial [Anaerolineae bacterium]|nr:hypothetical protein [Anaerolineae bacterium]